MSIKSMVAKWNKISLVKQICIGLAIGIILAVLFPQELSGLAILGELFTGALKAVAPVVVLFLVMAAISQHQQGQKTNIKSIIILYIIGTFLAALVSVVVSFIFRVDLVLTASSENVTPPGGLVEVLKSLVFKIVDNPVNAVVEANYIGILTWSILLGLALKRASERTKTVVSDLADAVSKICLLYTSLSQ